MARKAMDIVQAIGADEVKMRESGDWGVLKVGDVTVAGVGPSKREGENAKPYVRVQIDADVPKTLLRGLDTKPRPKGGVNIWVRSEAQAARVRPILERVAEGKTKAAS